MKNFVFFEQTCYVLSKNQKYWHMGLLGDLLVIFDQKLTDLPVCQSVSQSVKLLVHAFRVVHIFVTQRRIGFMNVWYLLGLCLIM